MAEIALLGAGSWGTALAVHLAGIGHAPRLLFRGAEAAARARSTRRHDVYLPGCTLPATVLPTADPGEALTGAELAAVLQRSALNVNVVLHSSKPQHEVDRLARAAGALGGISKDRSDAEFKRAILRFVRAVRELSGPMSDSGRAT